MAQNTLIRINGIDSIRIIRGNITYKKALPIDLTMGNTLFIIMNMKKTNHPMFHNIEIYYKSIKKIFNICK